MSMLLPVQEEVEAEEYGELGADFMGLATAWFAHKTAKVGISGALRCCGCFVKEFMLPCHAGDFPPLQGSEILYILQNNYSYLFLWSNYCS